MYAGTWKLNQVNQILFVLVNTSSVEVSGLGTGFTLEISKSGAAFAGSAGTKAEIGSGWYSYIATAAEADTIGPLAVKVTHASIAQQNLEYVVEQRTPGAIAYTYTAIDSVTMNPIPDAVIWITTDFAGSNVIWRGMSDAFGVARDANGNLPLLDPGTYYVWKRRVGYMPDQYPDTEVVP